MRILNYIGTLFVPSKMGFRKNINVFISLLILFLSSYIIAIPYMHVFEENAYAVYSEVESYNFRVMDNDVTDEVAFTEDEKKKLGDSYEYITFKELQEIDFIIENGVYKVPEDNKELKDIPFNHKIYLLKRNVYYYDADGTKLDKQDVYYIHIVFDIYTELKDSSYSIKNDFDKKLDLSSENHFLLLFNIDGFTYRNEYMVDNNVTSYAFAYGKEKIDFNEMSELNYIPHKLTNILIPETKLQYTFNSFMYTVIAPAVLALLAMVFMKRKNVLVTYKHYFNVAALASIPVTVLFFIIEWNEKLISIGIMELYWIVLAIYYFVTLYLIDRRSKIE